ncbi:hypothetical protein ACLOJK_005804 [Asimina triloba]
MSQKQPRRPQDEEEPIKYGDVFPAVGGNLSEQPIPPQDASMMQSAENTVLGQTQKGGPAAVMKSAAARNERAGYVGHRDVTEVAAEEGMTVTETDVPGHRIITEAVGGQVYMYIRPLLLLLLLLDFEYVLINVPSLNACMQTVCRYAEPAPISMATPASVLKSEAITIGQALEASALTAGYKPVEQSDAAAIQAAEARATGRNVPAPGGVASTAQSAATMNERTIRDEDKTKLAEVLSDASGRLPADKAVTREDAEGVVGAELRNNPNMATYPGGVAASVAAAAQLNQNQY